MPFIAIALVIAAAIGGGTSLAAQHSLPGDALWGFKVGVNEQLQAALAPEGKAQADFDIAAIETRMNEASTLAADGRLNSDTQVELESNLDAHAHNVQAEIEKLQAKGDYSAAADVAARFQSTVAAHVSGLADAQAHASTNANANAQAALTAVIGKVQATLDTASSLSADASAQAATHIDGDTSRPESNNDDHGTTTGGGATVQTGTSVKGGQGGIEVDSETGAQIKI